MPARAQQTVFFHRIKMNVNKDVMDEAFTKLLHLWTNWNQQPPRLSEAAMDVCLEELKAAGWRRRDLYHLLQKTCLPANYNLPPEAIDYLRDVETTITGCCHPCAIMRFPDENLSTEEELTAYVRSDCWKR